MVVTRPTKRFQHVSKVPFLFGTVGAVALPRPVLVRQLGYLGLSRSAATTLLQRMQARQMVSAEHVGRVVVHRLIGVLADRYKRLTGEAQPPWDGRLHGVILEIPEARRRARDHVLQVLRDLGLGQLRPGVWIGCWDRSGPVLAAVEGELVDGDLVLCTALSMSRDDAARALDLAYGLDARSARIRGIIERIERSDRRGTPTGAAALLASWRVAEQAIPELVAQADLVGELMPSDWPGAELNVRMNRYYQQHWPADQLFLLDDIANNPHAHLVERA